MFWKKKSQDVNLENPMLVAFRVENKEGTLSVHLDPAQLGNPAEAGIMLADIGRHMAHSLAGTSYQGSEEDAFHQIVNIFNAETNAPTQPFKGNQTQ